jgi:DNA-binding transcriptional regulator YiaG
MVIKVRKIMPKRRQRELQQDNFDRVTEVVTESKVELPERWVNPEVLKWARKRMGLSPEDLESIANISANDIRAWEGQGEPPTLANLEDLAEVYDCPVGYFFLDAPPDEEQPLDLRGLSPDKPKEE